MKADCQYRWKYVYGKNMIATVKGQKFADLKVQCSPQGDWTQNVWGSPIAIFYDEVQNECSS